MRSARVVSSVTITRFRRSRETPAGSVPSSSPAWERAGRDRSHQPAATATTTSATAAGGTHTHREIFMSEGISHNKRVEGTRGTDSQTPIVRPLQDAGNLPIDRIHRLMG